MGRGHSRYNMISWTSYCIPYRFDCLVDVVHGQFLFERPTWLSREVSSRPWVCRCSHDRQNGLATVVLWSTKFARQSI